MIFRQMITEDLVYIQAHALNADDRKIMAENVEYNYALVDGDITFGIAGFKFINATTAFCWMVMGDKAKENIIECHRCMKTWIPEFCRDFKIRRLEAYVEVGFEEGIRLVEHLGFEEESRMRHFIGDAPAIRFVRYFEEQS
jgi:hypothetical protein